MCGIFGIYNTAHPVEISEKKISEALSTMHHRGPDAKKQKVFKDKVGLGHLRLSIIDLNTENDQPLQIDERYWIVFNGEIYNYLELRNELMSLGYSFRTKGDTEVILRAYQEWGENCVQKFNGMWAFAIFDAADESLFCSRDRFGVKPFNYCIHSGQFIFSSEIKGILSYFPELRRPNYNVIANFCRNSIGAQIEQSWFKNILRLPPAHNLSINNKEVKIKRYWDYPREIIDNVTVDEAVLKYKEIISDSVQLRMRSDVPVGFTLSSGIDSSSLVCLLKGKNNEHQNTYTAAFTNSTFDQSEKKNFKEDVTIDEPALVRKLTRELDLNSNVVEIDFNNYVSNLQTIIHHLESGHGSPAVFPLDKILEVAAKDVKVVQEGQGADELLGGYISNVYPIYIIELLKAGQFGKALQEINAFNQVYSLKASLMLFIRQSNWKLVKSLYYYFTGIESFFKGKIKSYKHIEDYPIKPKGFDNLLNKHLYKAHTGGLVNLLHYGDAISMAHSLESRLPFMDYRLVEYVFKLPTQHKVQAGLGKYIHRVAMRGIVPDYILDNPLKFGFDSPLSHIFKQQDTNSPESILLSDRCLSRGLFSKTALRKAFEDQRTGRKDNSRLLYRLLSVELWFREFID